MRRIATMQLPSGGFSLWPGGSEVYPWGEPLRRPLPGGGAARRASGGRQSLRRAPCAGWPAQVKAKSDLWQRGAAADGYGLWVLARAGTAGPRDHGLPAPEADREDAAESRAMLAAAYAAAGNPRAVAEPAGRPRRGGRGRAPDRRQPRLRDPQPGAPAAGPAGRRAEQPAHPRPGRPAGARRPRRSPGGPPRRRASRCSPSASSPTARRSSRRTRGRSSWAAGRSAPSPTRPSASPASAGTDPIRLQMDAGYKPGRGLLQPAHPRRAHRQRLQAGDRRPGARPRLPGPRRQGARPQQRPAGRPGGDQDPRAQRLGVGRERGDRQSPPLGPGGGEPAPPDDGADALDHRRQSPDLAIWTCATTASSSSPICRPSTWQTFYTLVRAVAPGTFRLPPVQAEAMYNPSLRATSERGTMEVKLR